MASSRSKKKLKPGKFSKEANKLDGSDGIFRLPEAILQHVFFFLPIEDAIPLSATTKTWQKVWTSLPVLKFSFYHDEDNTLKDLVTLIKDSLSILRHHRAIIESFYLEMDPSQGEGFNLESHLDHWLSIMMKNYVKEIDVRVSSSSDNVFYTLPQSVFTSKSLVKLHLKGCKFPTKISFADEDKKSRFDEFNCLKDISLVNVVAQDDQIQDLVNLSRDFLEKLTIKTYPPVEILNLELFLKLDFIEANVKKLHVKQAMNLDTVVLYGLRRVYAFGVDNIKTLRCLTWDTSAYKSIKTFISSLPFLQTLQLFMLHNEKIQIQSQHLRTLLLYEGQRFEEAMEVELDTPRLRRIYFNGFSIPYITVYGQNQKLQLHHFGHPFGGIDGCYLHELGKFSLNLMQTMVKLHLHQIFIENLLTLQELREQPAVHHPPNVRMVVLECIPAASDYSSFLDALFWTCHPKALVVLMTTQETLKSPHRAPFLGYLVDELVLHREKNPICCSEHKKPKCWRHYMEKVEFDVYSCSMQEFDDDDEPTQLLTPNEDDDDDQIAENNGISIVDTPNKEGLVVQFSFAWLPYPLSW